MISEGEAQFKVGNAFYRSQSRLARDLGVLTAAIYRSEKDSLRVLDAMAGCGVRSLRYYLESQADVVWANEGNPEVSSVLRQNLAVIPQASQKITCANANQVFFQSHCQQDYYDLVDVDCFGCATPYLSTALWATKIGGLLYLTSTDGRTVTGHLPDNSLRAYGVYARSHPCAHEQGLRILIGSIQQQAAAKGWGIEPIFSLFSGQTYRVMVRLLPNLVLNTSNYGFLGYCHQCGAYQTVSWRKIGRVVCPCDGAVLTLSGPLWLASLHNVNWLEKLQAQAKLRQWWERVRLLEVMQEEANLPPYFYTLSEIGRRGKLDLPKRDHMIQALRSQGYHASVTHINPQAIKTDADLTTCIQVARNLST